MSTLLLIITVCSVALAVFAWAWARKVQRRERERSEARIAALSAAADNSVRTEGGWTQSGGEWEWTNDTPVSRDLGLGNRNVEPNTRVSTASTTPVSSERFFGTVEREEPATNRLPLFAAAALIILLGGALVFLNTSDSSSTESAASAARTAQSEPLELVSLAHARDTSLLTISGTVRNPSRGDKLEGLTAVVSLLDSSGALLSTKDVPLDYRALGPGEEAPFKVSIPDPGSIARYRVSFRAGTDVVPHVDRRNDSKLASSFP
jgi:hypothetical protein